MRHSERQPGERLRRLSAAFHKYGDAPRAARRPPRKARGGRIPRVFDRRATPRGGMHRRPNATVFMKVSTKLTKPTNPILVVCVLVVCVSFVVSPGE